MSEKVKHTSAMSEAILEITKKLPGSTVSAIPSDFVVDIGISGRFYNELLGVEDYLKSKMNEEEIIAAYTMMKLFAEDPSKITLEKPDVYTLWIINRLLLEIRYQSGAQKKTRVYDRDAFIKAHEDGTIVNDLSDEEINKRAKEESNED